MPAPFKKVFKLGDKQITSVVMDQSDFNALCDDLEGIKLHGGGRASKSDIDLIRASKNLPLMYRGTVTQKFFDKYEVETDYMCATVRGEGKNLLKTILPSPELN